MLLLVAGCATDKTELTIEKSPLADFSGSWELDHNLTESPRDKLRWLYDVTRSQLEQQQRQEKQAIGHLGARLPSRLPSRGRAGAINDLQGVIGLGTLAESISRSLVLTIEQSPGYIVVERDGDYSLTCDFEQAGVINGTRLGREYCGIDPNGQLIFIVSLPEGLTVSNRMVLSPNGERLNVATTVRSNEFSREFTLNRVYMPFEPGESQFECEYTLEKKKTCWLGTDKDLAN